MYWNIKQLTAASVVVCLAVPTAAMAGTRAGPPPTVATTAPASNGNQNPGPKNGFPASPGLEIAKIKASSHAAFKRKSAGT